MRAQWLWCGGGCGVAAVRRRWRLRRGGGCCAGRHLADEGRATVGSEGFCGAVRGGCGSASSSTASETGVLVSSAGPKVPRTVRAAKPREDEGEREHGRAPLFRCERGLPRCCAWRSRRAPAIAPRAVGERAGVFSPGFCGEGCPQRAAGARGHPSPQKSGWSYGTTSSNGTGVKQSAPSTKVTRPSAVRFASSASS